MRRQCWLLWQSQHHDTEDFAKMVLERFAGVQNIYVADENDTIVVAALAVPVTLQGRTGNYLCLCGEGSLLLAGLLDTLCAQQKLRGGFTVAVPADAAQAALLQDKWLYRLCPALPAPRGEPKPVEPSGI